MAGISNSSALILAFYPMSGTFVFLNIHQMAKEYYLLTAQKALPHLSGSHDPSDRKLLLTQQSCTEHQDIHSPVHSLHKNHTQKKQSTPN